MRKNSVKSSIFTRYMSAFLMIIFVSFTILTVIISSMTIQAANEQKKDDAQQNMALLKTYIDDMWKNTFPHNSFEQFVKQNNTEIATMINILSRKSDEMNVFITTPDGKILVSTDGIYSGKRISDGDVLSALTSANPSIYSQLYSDMGGLLEKKHGMFVTAFNYGNSSYDGALIVCYGTGELDMLSKSTIKTIILASLWVMIASFIAVYFISEKIVSDIDMANYFEKAAVGTKSPKAVFSMIDPFALLGVRTDAAALLCFALRVYSLPVRLSIIIFRTRKIFSGIFSLLPVNTMGAGSFQERRRSA